MNDFDAIIIGAANNGVVASDGARQRITFQLLLCDFSRAAALGQRPAGAAITNPRCVLPRALFYNDGGFDVSPCGQFLCSCAELWLPHGADLPLPQYATPDSAGLDLLAAVSEDVSLAPGERTLLPTGIALSLPRGYEAQIRPRSGLALKNGLTLLNTPGTIDADYRGEIGVILANLGQETFVIERGMRIAQMVVATVSQVSWNAVESLDDSERGAGGFGSTGTADG